MNVDLLSSEQLLFVLGIAAVASLVYFTFIYRIESKNSIGLKGNKKWVLWFFRVAIALFALLALAKPSVTRTVEEVRDPVVAFLIDQSASMSFPASIDNPLLKNTPDKKEKTRFNAAKKMAHQLQGDLHKTHDLRIYGFSDTVQMAKAINRDPSAQSALPETEVFGEKFLAEGQYSNVGDGLQDSLRELSSNQISGIVLMSDGRETGGEPVEKVIRRAKKAGIPVHTVVFGTEFPLRDLSIDEIVSPAEASLGDVFTFNLKITNQISSLLETSISVFEEGKEISKKPVKLKRGQNIVPIPVIPEVEGTRKFEFKIPLQPDEINEKNNEYVMHIEVVKRGLKVLLIAGQPSLEYYYLVPALLRDPIVELSCFLQTADVDYTHQGNRNIKELPKTVKDWQGFDVCVFLDVDPTLLTPPQINGLENMVNKGGGLYVVTGRTHGLSKLVQVHGAKIRSMLPVDVDPNYYPNHDEVFERSFKVVRSKLGKAHPILLTSANPKVNTEVWNTFPEFFWFHPVKGPKSNAITLLEKDGGSKADVVMAIHRYGEGAVLYAGIGDFWRWRYPYESYDYDRLWIRSIRYLGETKLLGNQQSASLSTDRKVYNPGEEVQVVLQLQDFALVTQLEGVQLYAKVETPEKDITMVPLKQNGKGEPFFSGTTVAKGVGSMLVSSTQSAPGADSQAKPLFDVKHSFKVERTSLEEKDTSADLEKMRLLAEETGGKYIDYKNMSEFKTIVSAIPKEPQVLRKDISAEIWDSTIFLLIFILFAGMEWSLRKWWGLL